jgi:hypothetical protein
MRYDFRTTFAFAEIPLIILYPCDNFTNAGTIILSFSMPNITILRANKHRRVHKKTFMITFEYLCGTGIISLDIIPYLKTTN